MWSPKYRLCLVWEQKAGYEIVKYKKKQNKKILNLINTDYKAILIVVREKNSFFLTILLDLTHLILIVRVGHTARFHVDLNNL